ncbi:AraC family transcriptional regulator [Mesobaculum littorinae]|uniref:AraC family transcriptional regulator n=1 Tax=Mesobaculum littorinae TaxID=2486419 RepID=UPI0019D43C2B|nr:AraC family transcriptional regulator [Mesobaculum littorinae]
MSLFSTRAFPRHAHDQFGLGVVRVGGHASWSACGPVEAGPGDVIAVSPEEMHDGAPVGPGREWEMLYVDPATVARFVEPEAARREIGFAAVQNPGLAARTDAALSALRSQDARAAEDALTDLLSLVLAPASTADTARLRGAPSPATRRVQERIADQPDAPPSLDEVAMLMGMGRTGALRRFRRETGATPHAYAMQVRLRLARRALASGEPPAEVAAGFGFADQAHLTRAFARQFGLPPGRWRKGLITPGAKIVQDGDSSTAP